MTDPYDHIREAFHITADGLMDWKECPEPPERRSNGLGASYRESDIGTLETAAESLSRAGDLTNAVALWALALRVRHGS
jgi:hypothetical protein